MSYLYALLLGRHDNEPDASLATFALEVRQGRGSRAKLLLTLADISLLLLYLDAEPRDLRDEGLVGHHPAESPT